MGGGAHDAQGLLLRRVGEDCYRDEHERDRRAHGHVRSVEKEECLQQSQLWDSATKS